MAVKKAAKRDGLMAVNWVHKMVGWMADCWAGRVVVLRVGSRVNYMAGKMAQRRAM